MKKCIAAAGAGLFFFSVMSHAETFKILGSRALGMGGAHVAVVGDTPSNCDAVVQYWNPAALGTHKGFDTELPVFFGVEATGGILDSANDISKSASDFTAINQAQQNGDYIDLAQVKSFTQGLKNLDKLNAPGLGMIANVGAGVNSSFGHWAFSVNNFTSLGVDPSINIAGISLASGTIVSPAPRLRRARRATTNYDGIDFSQIPNIATYITAPANSNLAAASGELATTIDALVGATSVNLGGYTPAEIANALVNLADSQGVSEAEIVSNVAQIKETEPILLDLISVANGTLFSQNDSNLTVQGISYSEAALGYGRDLRFISEKLNKFYIGGNIKYIQGSVGFLKQNVFDEEVSESSTLLSDFNDNLATSSNISADVGFLFVTTTTFKLRAGVVARDINSPSFKQPKAAIDSGFGDYKIQPQVRAGLALYPVSPVIIAIDYDLTKNKTPIDGYFSQVFGLGAEVNVVNQAEFNLALRFGVLQNMANDKSSMAWTGGIGLNLFHFILDFGGAISSETVEIEDGSTIPSSAYAMMSLGMNF